MKNFFLSLFVFAVVTLFATSAAAWDGPAMWFQSPTGGPGGPDGPGGGGILGTGGATDHNITCAHCHIKGTQTDYGTVDLKVSFNPAIAPGGSYKLGQTYAVTVAMQGEHLGKTGCEPNMKNANAFAASFEDDTGKVAGALSTPFGSTASCPATLPSPFTSNVFTYGDCHAVIGHVDDGSTPTWTFSWTAPATSKLVTLYYAGVDGNCMMDSMGDDVKVGTVKLGAGVALAEPRPNGNRMLAALLAFPAMGIVATFRRRPKKRSE